ncbi:hypothetical protein KP509_21G001100 [Ceratopteris richardii]|uniref:RING-type E3 ubiquitin transferase n=1 Tax=Ceratopteris richardii TaxID=49495 RepID=A0A8T2S6X0_CERRI|nr:hypothetical protein KP509_21G001100 [Ceratopteris richardii]
MGGPPSNSTSSDYYDNTGYVDPGQQPPTITSKLTIIALLIVFSVLLFLSSVHLYGKWLWRTRRGHRRLPLRRLNSQGQQALALMGAAPLLGMGLSKDVLSTIPTFIHSAKVKSGCVDEDSQKRLECSVCLSEFQDGEEGRVLPVCNHVFHSECIDMWFFSHKTCPLCRKVVEGTAETSPSFAPTNETHLEVGSEEAESAFEVRVSVHSTMPIESERIAHTDTITEPTIFPGEAIDYDDRMRSPLIGSPRPVQSPARRFGPVLGKPSSSSSSSSSSRKPPLRNTPPHITIQIPPRQDIRIPSPGCISLPSRRLTRSLVSPDSTSSSSSPSASATCGALQPPPSIKSPGIGFKASLNRVQSMQSMKGNGLLSGHLSPTLLKDGRGLPMKPPHIEHTMYCDGSYHTSNFQHAEGKQK